MGLRIEHSQNKGGGGEEGRGRVEKRDGWAPPSGPVIGGAGTSSNHVNDELVLVFLFINGNKKQALKPI